MISRACLLAGLSCAACWSALAAADLATLATDERYTAGAWGPSESCRLGYLAPALSRPPAAATAAGVLFSQQDLARWRGRARAPGDDRQRADWRRIQDNAKAFLQ